MVCPMSGAVVGGIIFKLQRPTCLPGELAVEGRCGGSIREKLPTVRLKWLHSCQEVKV